MGLLPSIKVPRIKLPKLKQLALGIPVTLIAGFTLLKKFSLITNFLNSALSPLQLKLKQLTSAGGITGIGNGIKSAISGAINSITGLIKQQVTGVSNAKSLVQGLINQLNQTKNELSNAAKNVKNLLEKEVELDEENEGSALSISSVETSITKTVKKNFEALDNKQQKELIEDPVKKEEFIDEVTGKCAKASEKTLENQINQKKEYTENVKTVEKLEASSKETFEYDILYEQPVLNLENASRLTLVRYLTERLTSSSLAYYPIRQYPELRAPVEAEIVRIRRDIAENPDNYSGKLYIKNLDYIRKR
jgi:hypothetical protein